MMGFMANEDFINLRHDVDRHESDLDRQLQQIQSLEKDVRELVDLVRLMSKFVHRDLFLDHQDQASKEFDLRLPKLLESGKHNP
jgi:hypothetical protein